MSNEVTISPASGGCAPALAAVLVFQQKLFAAQNEVVRLERAIKEQQDSAEQLKRSEPDLSEMDAHREALLARIAIGETGREDLAALDQEQEAARVDAVTQKVRAELQESECRQAVAGLSKRLDAARQNLAALTGQQPKLLGALILEESQCVYEGYLSAAMQLRESYVRLMGLARLGGDKRQFECFYGPLSIDIDLPMIRYLRGPDGPHSSWGNGMRFYSSHLDKQLQPDLHTISAKAEEGFLRAKGVKLHLKF